MYAYGVLPAAYHKPFEEFDEKKHMFFEMQHELYLREGEGCSQLISILFVSSILQLNLIRKLIITNNIVQYNI